MGFLIGIILTILSCLAATGMWGEELQILGICSLGIACLIADVKGLDNNRR